MVEQTTSSMAEQVYDLIALPWLGRHQHQLTLDFQSDINFGWPNVNRYSRVIALATKPPGLCQPFFYLHREEVKYLVPGMHEMLGQVDIDVPPITPEDRRRVFSVDPTYDHTLAKVLEEVQLFALLDYGKNIDSLYFQWIPNLFCFQTPLVVTWTLRRCLKSCAQSSTH